MHAFAYKNNDLYCESVKLEDIARALGTPTYVYSKKTILEHFRGMVDALKELDAEVAFAVKSCSNIAILNLLAREGAGFDIVSGGELFRVLKAGGDPQKCTYAGVGKTAREIRYALERGIYCFNAESEAELAQINLIAGSMGLKAPVSVRVNPNVDAKTHKYISTGKAENKFGVDMDKVADLYARCAAQYPHLYLKGVQMHIGSQLTEVRPFAEAVEKLTPLVLQLKKDHQIEFFSIGGGLGIAYQDSLAAGSPEWWQENANRATIQSYAAALVPLLKPLGLRIIVEPGRVIVGNAGVLLTECLYEKKGNAKTFKIIDSGMNDLIRPALYEGYHELAALRKNDATLLEADLVGPICESGDFFAQSRSMEDFQAGDYLAVLSAGAYGFSMASNYNSRPLPAEVLVHGATWQSIRARQTWDDLVLGESLPE